MTGTFRGQTGTTDSTLVWQDVVGAGRAVGPARAGGSNAMGRRIGDGCVVRDQ